jgi:DNA polymerase III alpha subunit
MKKNKFGEMIFDSDDLCDLIMQGHTVTDLDGVIVGPTVDLEKLISHIEDPASLLTWTPASKADNIPVPEFDLSKQSTWFMPSDYKNLDIAQHILSLCTTQEELQRVGEELLLFQEHNLFDLLRFLKYLVDTMQKNHVIWGVGRGSSVASYVLYLMGVHKINSLHYDLDPREFLR